LLLHKDDTIYDTVFQTTSGFALIIRVYLPVHTTAPSFTLHGVRATHDWLDIRMKVIGYSPILSDASWKTSNLRLGDAVYAVIHHFQLNPPTVMEITDVNLKRLQESLNGDAARRIENQSAPPAYRRPNEPMHVSNGRENHRLVQSMGNVSMQQQSPDEVTDEEVHTLIPAIPSSFPQLESMTMSQVKDLLDNESSFEDFIQQTSEVATLNELKQSIMSANVDAAEANLLHREKVERQTAELDSLGDDLQMKLEQFNKLDQERVALTSPPDLNATIKYLNHVKKEAYRQSEAIADDWVESGGDVGDFVKKFMEKRALYHTRAAKAERLSMSM
jgi:hypothetical protein